MTVPLAERYADRLLGVRIERTCIEHRFASASIKMYDKIGCILRIETTTNDVSFFKHDRHYLEHLPAIDDFAAGIRALDRLTKSRLVEDKNARRILGSLSASRPPRGFCEQEHLNAL
ncbi:hypothetical protein FHP25_31140 [Vineibacter terrae]|uniref:Uncharacterized protein n=1 Tax=Vineibacter terrae TaxID=2586908 RepID=A0A5C8PDG8_9HYPH|nr:hypothetical protein [Vineibacter terrae]TXL71172.1 hypothetical protein FHP25_31140 [Vineibacter terrae]